MLRLILLVLSLAVVGHWDPLGLSSASPSSQQPNTDVVGSWDPLG